MCIGFKGGWWKGLGSNLPLPDSGAAQVRGIVNSLDLEGVNAKISRARECLQTLETDIRAFCDFERRRRAFEIESSAQIIVSENLPEVPIGYSIRVGEIAYTLRSALDQLAWQLVIYNGKTPRCGRAAFPIANKEKTTKKQYRKWARDKVDGMAQEHIDAIEALQPFNNNSAVGPHLKMLNAICNIDKHRHLNVVADHTRVGRTEHEDKAEADVIVDICFVDEELVTVSPGYGSAIESAMEGEPLKRPPIAPVLWGCLTAVQFVVDRLNSRLVTILGGARAMKPFNEGGV